MSIQAVAMLEALLKGCSPQGCAPKAGAMVMQQASLRLDGPAELGPVVVELVKARRALFS